MFEFHFEQTDMMKRILQKELNLPILEIADRKATLDGSDVLFTGREFFVGLSSRTNEGGARAVASAFPEYPVTPIRVPSGGGGGGRCLHLKSAMSMAGPDILAVGSSPEAQDMLHRIEREATYRYNLITVPDDEAANCLYINGLLLYDDLRFNVFLINLIFNIC